MCSPVSIPPTTSFRSSSAKASLDAAERQVETAELARNRAEQLFAKNVSPEIAARAGDAELRSGGCDAAMPPVRPFDRRRTRSVYTDLKSDQNGIVTAVNADVGQVVGSGTPV